MSESQNNAFKKLGRFCEDEFEDSWEDSEIHGSSSNVEDRYSDKNLIASGGMKEIYKVFDNKMDRHIAMAQLIPNSPEEYCEPFLREATLTASLEHPNIISVYDLGVNENHDPFFTMELKVGESLKEIIKNNNKPLSELLGIFLKVCDAISYAHSQSIIHLDLKPDNIQVGQFGEVQVCDWGLSQKQEKAVTTKTIKGTPGFMAPEQSKPGQTLDKRTDIFALGGILYSILTGEPPFEGGVQTVIDKTRNEKVIAPIERFSDKQIASSLSAVVCKAMEPSKEDRYQNVDELKNEVNNFLTGRSTNAENAGFIKELQLFIKRNKQVCLVALSAFILIILATVLFLAEIQKSKNDTELALSKLKKTHSELITSKQQEKTLFAQKEEALKMYIEANKEKQEAYHQLLTKELRQAYDLMIFPLYYSSPQKSLDKSLNILKSQLRPDKEQPGIESLIVLNLFVSQKFDQIQKYNSKKYKALFSIAEKYKNEPKTTHGILNEKRFVKLLRDINNLPEEEKEVKHDVIERSIAYMVDVRQPIFTSVDVVRELLVSWNPDWNPDNIEYDSSKLSLRLRGNKLNKIIAWAPHSSSKCFLRLLKIDHLDIRGTGISGLNQLEGLDINKLDIRNTPVKNLHPHGATKGIKEVYLSKGQFDKESEERIPRAVRLIFK